MRILKRLGLLLITSCFIAMGSTHIAQAGPYKSMVLHYGGIEAPALFPVFIPEGFVFQTTTYPDQATDAVKSPGKILKRGEASVINILHLLELGDGSIDTAAKNGGITKIHYVDNAPLKVNIYNIFFKRQKTVVYGE